MPTNVQPNVRGGDDRLKQHRVDDSFLEQLAQSQAVGTLEQLDLSLCGITNAGLAHLRPFTHLRFVGLFIV